MRLLIVEDDTDLRNALKQYFEEKGFVVDVAGDGEEGYYYASDFQVDAAIIDLGLPKLSGIDLIKKLRKDKNECPVVILTARDRWQDKVEGLQAGADDYVAKPFHLEEVEARVQAVIRRAGGSADKVVEAGPLKLDLQSQQVMLSGSEIVLTTFEYKLLESLMLNAGKVLSKNQLTDKLYAMNDERDSNVIEVFIGRLRKKLDPANELRPIETLRGRGYRFAL